MSFGVSISDIAMLVNLAWSTLEGARKACGEHDELTKEISSLHTTLEHLQSEIADPDSVINFAKGGRRKDLEIHIGGCRRHLRRINSVLTKYNALQSESGQVWQRIQFGTGAVKDISKSQLKLSTYTTAITLTLHLLSLGSQGRIEKELSHQRGEAKGLRASINLLLAKQNVVSREGTRDGSILSNSHDEREFWRSFRRELAEEGFKSSVLSAHKDLIKAYVKELSDRGALDEKTLRVQPAVSLSADPRVDLDNTPSSSRYRQPTVDDSDNLSIDNLSIDEPSEAEASPQKVSTLPEHGNRGEPATVDDSDRIPSDPRDQPQGSPPVSVSSLHRTYELSPVSYAVAPHILELAERIQHLEEINRQQHVLLRSINLPRDQMDPTVEREEVQDVAVSEPKQAENSKTEETAEAAKVSAESTASSDPNKPLCLSVDEYLEILQNNDELESEALAIIRSNAFSRLVDEDQKLTIILEDSDGSKFCFPYYMVKTWRGMQYAVEHVSHQMDTHAEQVRLHNYYLTGTDGVRIVPEFWHTFIEPAMTVLMRMQPLSECSNVLDAPAPENMALVSRAMTPPTTYNDLQRDYSPRCYTPPRPKPKFSLSVLLFSPKKRKSKRPDPAPRHPPQSRKRHKRAPPTPRCVSPSPSPPAWWLYERQRRRPPGYERGRSPSPRYPVAEGYSRTIVVYPEANYDGVPIYELE